MTSFSAGYAGKDPVNDEISRLREEIKFLVEQINGLKSRIGSTGNAVQRHNLDMLSRLLERCNRSMAALEKRGAAA